MYDASCDFCRIGRSGQSAEVVAEGASWVAFFPLNPATPGHTLIVPRVHVEDLWSADHELVADLAQAALDVGHAIGAALHPDGMNLITSAGATAEQTVFHLHLHVVPRWKADGFGHIWPIGERYEVEDLGDAAALIRRAFSGHDQGDNE
jgi:histidine triad (HIT) family protein